ncbi:hypothetical protein T10_13185, partial [Trichinella papuae]
GSLRGDHKELIGKPCKSSTHKRPKPIHPVVPPPPADKCRTESPCRVHRSTIERTAGEDVCSDDEAYGKRCNGAEMASLRVDRRGIDGVDQSKRQHDLEHYDCSKELGHPVVNGMDERDPATDKGTKGYGRVDVPAGGIEGDGDCNKQGQRMGYGNHHKAASGGGVPVQLLERKDGAFAGEYKDGGADELREGSAHGVGVDGIFSPAEGETRARRHGWIQYSSLSSSTCSTACSSSSFGVLYLQL